MENWIENIVYDMVNNYIEDDYLAETTDEECDKIVKQICELIFEDSDLENEITHLIQDSAEWYYYHCIKNRKENK